MLRGIFLFGLITSSPNFLNRLQNKFKFNEVEVEAMK